MRPQLRFSMRHVGARQPHADITLTSKSGSSPDRAFEESLGLEDSGIVDQDVDLRST